MHLLLCVQRRTIYKTGMGASNVSMNSNGLYLYLIIILELRVNERLYAMLTEVDD